MLQIASNATGLTLNDGSAITFAAAVVAINALRDALGGTSSSSVENPLTRTPTSVSGVTIASPGPDLFAADANSIAYTRIPRQVLLSCWLLFLVHILQNTYPFHIVQVLDIVYFGSYTSPGGFFPYGISGVSYAQSFTFSDGVYLSSCCFC